MPAPTNNPAPTTDYGQALKEVGGAYALPTQEVQQQQAQALKSENTTLSQLAATRQTNLSSLDQAKTNAFTNNALTSNARGIMYSGYTPFTNNAYTVGTYNPGVQKTNTDYTTGVSSAKTSYGNTMTSLKDKINEINQARANAAQSLVLDTKNAQAQAALSASKSATSAANAAQKMNLQSFTSNIKAGLIRVMGSDKHVSPANFRQALNLWTQKGLPASEFYDTYSSFINTSHIQDYVR